MFRFFTPPICFAAMILTVMTMPCRAESDASTAEAFEFFEKEVRPRLAEHCYECHSVQSEKLQAGLLVDSRDALLLGGDSGQAIIPGEPDQSLLIQAVRYESYEMPPKGKLPPEDIDVFERWVAMGSPWPDEPAPSANAQPFEFNLQQRKDNHWVWQPIRSPAIPSVTDQTWPRDEMDHFILSGLEELNLRPAADADRSALVRRLYFDLTGLPPTSKQAAKYLEDSSADATENLVDELLSSPHFGERWARHWLDLVRYAESRGHEFDNDSPNAFQYRDYVIRALNADVPYDQFVREHVAGDLISEPRLHPDEGYNESILGTGFWFLGEWVHSPVDTLKDEADRFDNMIDVMSKTFLGVTVACARCHDHKFDAISTADYYSLAGFLQSSDYRQVRFESHEHHRAIAEELARLDAEFQQEIMAQLTTMGVKTPEVEPIDPELAKVIVADYQSITPDQFMQDGFLFGKQPLRIGEPLIDMVDDAPVIRFATTASAKSDPFWDGLESISEKGIHNRDRLMSLPRSGRTLRTPTFTLEAANVVCRVQGTGHVVACVDSHRLIAGPLHGETIQQIKAENQWVELNLGRYLGHRLHLEFTPAENSHLQVSLVAQGLTQKQRQQWAEREGRIEATVNEFAGSASRAMSQSLTELATAWSQQRTQLQGRLKHRSRLAMAMLDGSGEDQHVYIRGNSSKPGQLEPRHFLTAIRGDDPLPIDVGSGRLELAKQINAPDNPLTSRVIVNRLWHYLMGQGIVPTTDDFGVLGQSPTHPELLDYLAMEFLRDGQSLKRMIRRIVLSRTYQMSSQPDDLAMQIDPKNERWHHRPPRRLEGEAIRDALLTISGRLDPTPFGEPIPIHLTSFMDGRGRPGKSGPLDGEGRRSIYIAVRRNFISPFMMAFDTPIPFSTMGRRNVSNVPAQALILMNDPFVVDQAKQWAERAIARHDSAELRVQWMYRTAFARSPKPQEMEIALEFLVANQNPRPNTTKRQDDLSAWLDFAHALINTKEFIFLR